MNFQCICWSYCLGTRSFICIHKFMDLTTEIKKVLKLENISIILFRSSEELLLIVTKDLWLFDVQVTVHRDKLTFR